MTDVRVTQGAIEALVEQARGTLKVTQGAVEVLVEQARGDVKLTQGAIEVMHDDITPLPEPPYSEELGALRVTQHSVSVLSSTDPDARTTQAAAMVMYAPGADARITQTPALVLHDVLNQTRITQTVALALVDQVCCHTRWTQILKITRTDGQIFAYTTHSKDIVWRGVMYKACDSFSSTATESSMDSSSKGSMEITGVLSETGISDKDIFYGLFREASVALTLIPWENSNNEPPIQLISGVIGESSITNNSYRFELLTPATLIDQRPLLETYTPSCRYRFGDSRCKLNVTSDFSDIGTVTSVPNLIVPNLTDRQVFIDSNINSSSPANGLIFDYGRVMWTSGNNNGITSEIQSYNESTGQFSLREPLPYKISVGDNFIAIAGCDKTDVTCATVYDNFINFGGFPHIPGVDHQLSGYSGKSKGNVRTEEQELMDKFRC